MVLFPISCVLSPRRRLYDPEAAGLLSAADLVGKRSGGIHIRFTRVSTSLVISMV